MGIKVLSLFDGISCGRLALERAGIEVDRYYASEIEPHAEAVSRFNYPDIIRLGDVNNYEKWELPQIDLLIGGSPCQDLSIAKANREGLSGEKSGLFWKYVEVLHTFKPKYFLLENNNSMPKEAKDTISEILGVEPILINSALVSGQLRKRLYWTNTPNVVEPTDKGIKLQDILESGIVDREKALCLTRRYAGFHGCQDYYRHRYFGKSFGQAVFEGEATPEEHKAAYKEFGKYSGIEVNGEMRQMTHIECERLQTLPDNYTKYELVNGKAVETPKGARYEMIGNGWTVDAIAHIMTFLKKALKEGGEEVKETTTEDKQQEVDKPLKIIEIEQEVESEEMEERVRELEAKLAEKEKESEAKSNEIMKLKAQLFDLMTKASA